NRRISRSSRRNPHRNFPTSYFLDAVDYFAHRIATSGTQVEFGALSPALQIIQCLDMTVREVADVNVIANAGAVGCGVIVAEDLQRIALPQNGFKGRRDQARLAFMNFAQLAAFVRAGGIEIAQRRGSDAIRAIVSLQRVLEEELGGPIGIHRVLDGLIRNGNLLGNAISSAGGGEDNVAHSGVECSI